MSKYRNIKVSGKSVKAPENVYFKLKDDAGKQGLSISAYLGKLIAEDEVTVVPMALSKHFGALDKLFTEYVDPLFSEIFAYLRPILLKAVKLDKEKRKEFIEGFNKLLEKELDSMATNSNGKGED